MAIPIKARDILITRNLLALHTHDAVLQHLDRGVPRLVQVPYPGCAVSTATGQQILFWIPGTDEHLAVVALE